MKKILSLLLVCAMIFSFAAISVNADGEAYVLKYVDIKANATTDPLMGTTSYSKGYDTTNTATATATIYTGDMSGNRSAEVFAVAVSANAVFAGGQFGLTWDSTVITPAFVNVNASTGAMIGQTIDDLNAAYDKSLAYTISQVASSETLFEVDGFAMAWSMNGGLAANTDMLYIHFAFNEGKSKADLNADSIKFGYADSILATATDAAKGVANQYGAAYLVSNAGGKYSTADASNANRTYPNSDVSAGGDDPVVTESCVVAGGVATVTAVYDEDVAGTAIIAVYDADGRMIAHKVGDAVSGKNFTIATDAFEGTADIVKVFVWENVGSKNTAKVSAKVFDVE